jgi:hypothetical protein
MAQDDIQCGGSTALSETITTVNLLIRWKTNSDPLAAKMVASRYTDFTVPTYTFTFSILETTVRNVHVLSVQ